MFSSLLDCKETPRTR